MKATRLIISLFTCSTVLFAADWPQYRGPTHDGKTTEKMSMWPNNGSRPLWKVPTPNGFSSFAVKDRRAYTIIAREEDGVPREVLIALDGDTGKEVWSVPFASPRYGHDGGNAGAGDPRTARIVVLGWARQRRAVLPLCGPRARSRGLRRSVGPAANPRVEQRGASGDSRGAAGAVGVWRVGGMDACRVAGGGIGKFRRNIGIGVIVPIRHRQGAVAGNRT